MRLREEMLAFQKRFKELKKYRTNFYEKKVPYVKFLGYFMFFVTAFPIIRKKRMILLWQMV